MAHASLRGGVGISGITEPCAFLHQPPQAAIPLAKKFINVVAAHLIHHKNDDELGPQEGSNRCRRACGWRGGILRDGILGGRIGLGEGKGGVQRKNQRN